MSVVLERDGLVNAKVVTSQVGKNPERAGQI
jgi:hypothetical protein